MLSQLTEKTSLISITKIVDSKGNVVPTANNLVRFQLHGQGQIVGVDNGEQASRERYKEQAEWFMDSQSL